MATCRTRAASLGIRNHSASRFLECLQLLEAKDAEIRRLRCHLEEVQQEHLSGTGEHVAQVFRSQRRSRSRLADLATKQHQQLERVEEAASTAEHRTKAAAEALGQARTRLGLLSVLAKGMEQKSKELHRQMELEVAQEAEAFEAFEGAEKQGLEVRLEIDNLEQRAEEAQREEAMLETWTSRQDRCAAARPRTVRQTGDSVQMCQELAAEREVLQKKLRQRHSQLLQVREEQEAAIPRLEQELEDLEAVRRARPADMPAALEEKHMQKQALQTEVSQMEFELRAAHRHQSEQHRKMTLALANCRREIESKEAKAKWSSAQCLKPMENEYQEALQRFSHMQQKARQHQAKRRVGNAFKVPLLQQRAGKPPIMEAVDADDEPHQVPAVLRRCSKLRVEEAQLKRELERWRDRELLVVSQLHDWQHLVNELRGREVDQTELSVELAHWRDCVDSLRREQSWLAEECHYAERENEVRESSQLQAIMQLQQELSNAQGSET